MIIAALVVVLVIGCLLGRFCSYVVLLAMSPLLAVVVASAAWTAEYGGLQAALLGLGTMVVSQAGFLAGVALDSQSGIGVRFRRSSAKQGRVKKHQTSAPNR